MSVKENFDSLMQKPLSRKQFLQHVGILALAVIGLGPLLHLLTGSHDKTDGGYGVTPFGK